MSDQMELLVHGASNLITELDSRVCPEDMEGSTPFLGDTVMYPSEEVGHGVQGLEVPLIPRPPVKPKPPRQSRLLRLHSLESMKVNRRAKVRSSQDSSSEAADTDSSCGSHYGDFSGSPLLGLKGRSAVASQKLLSRGSSSSSSSSGSLRDCEISRSAGSTTEFWNSPPHLDSAPKEPAIDKLVPPGRRKLPPVAHTKLLPPIAVNIESSALRTSNRIDLDYVDYIQAAGKVQSNQQNHFLSPSQGTEDSQSSISMTSSSSVMVPILSEDLRSRSYMDTNLLAGGSLLGAGELYRYFPNKMMQVYIATWNTQGTKEFPDSLEDLLLPSDSQSIHDLYVIGTQEGIPDK